MRLFRKPITIQVKSDDFYAFNVANFAYYILPVVWLSLGGFIFLSALVGALQLAVAYPQPKDHQYLVTIALGLAVVIASRPRFGRSNPPFISFTDAVIFCAGIAMMIEGLPWMDNWNGHADCSLWALVHIGAGIIAIGLAQPAVRARLAVAWIQRLVSEKELMKRRVVGASSTGCVEQRLSIEPVLIVNETRYYLPSAVAEMTTET